MVDTSNNKVTDGNISATRPNLKDTSGKDTSGAKREAVSTEETDEEKASREEDEARASGFKYAGRVFKSTREDNENLSLDSEADQKDASWLVANGYAEMHSIQEGTETTNYILMTEDGARAFSTYNEEEK